MDQSEHTPGDQRETVQALLNSIHAYFAMLANCERLSLSDSEDANVLSLNDVTHISGTGLDLIERLQDKLKAENSVSAPVRKSEKRDPLAGLKELPLDRAVTLYLNSGHSLTGAMAESPDTRLLSSSLGTRALRITISFRWPALLHGLTCGAKTQTRCFSMIGST